MPPKPLIGISSHFISNSEGWQNVYAGWRPDVDEIQKAGGFPLLVPPVLEEEEYAALLEQLDGFLISGGWDVNEEFLGEERHPLVRPADRSLDVMELAMARAAMRSGKPLLAICRGAQVLNVAAGGNLILDIPTQHPGALVHSPEKDQPAETSAHDVTLEEGSLIARILQATRVRTNSYHHQAVKRVGEGLVVNAHAPDGIIEGVELPSHPFCLGVQWHPEIHKAIDEGMEKIFLAFITAAREAS